MRSCARWDTSAPNICVTHGAQLAVLVERCAATDAAAVRAEEVASAAMSAAEGAVRDEMEAAAVAKEIASALDKALTDLQARLPVFASICWSGFGGVGPDDGCCVCAGHGAQQLAGPTCTQPPVLLIG